MHKRRITYKCSMFCLP